MENERNSISIELYIVKNIVLYKSKDEDFFNV